MKIEKISDTQVKFVLNKSDLTVRNIKLSELAYGSEKTQQLFHEMMEQASIECDFHSENIPLMIEAIPITLDSIMVIVTKVPNPKEFENKFNLFSALGIENKLKNTDNLSKSTKPKDEGYIIIYSFKTIDQVISVSSRLNNVFNGLSSVYKYNAMFYLVLESINNEKIELDYILSEFADKHVSGLKSKYYLVEHGEVIIKDKAVEKLYNI